MFNNKAFAAVLILLLLFFLTALPAAGQVFQDTVNVKPNTELTLDFNYDFPDTAAFNDVLAYRGEIIWPQTDGFAMIYVDGSHRIGDMFDGFLNVVNEDEVEFHRLIVSGASATGVRVDRDTTFITMTFITPDTFTPQYVNVLSTFTLNESPTIYTHSYVIYVDPNHGVNTETPEDFDLGITADLYPNPNPQTLELNLETPSYTTVEVVDILGRTRQTLMNDSFLADETLVDLSFNHLEAGTYFLVTRTNQTRHVKLFTVTR